MKTNYVLIDYENVQVKSLDLLRGEHFRVHVFLGPSNTKLHKDLVLAMQELGDRAEYVELEVSGSNALDFHLAYYLGKLATMDPAGFFHIISKDTGFDPLIRYLKSQKILCARSESIAGMPCFAKAPADAATTEPSIRPAEPLADLAPPADPLMKLVLDDLHKRKSAKPRTAKTLKSTMQARCGSDVPAATIEALYAELVARGYVHEEGAKVSYSLPAL